MESNYKLVDFEKYCPTCKNKNLPDDNYPCDECLEVPAREYSHKPSRYEEDN